VTRGDSSGGFARPGAGLSPGRCEVLHCKELLDLGLGNETSDLSAHQLAKSRVRRYV
jgi:hypothetical protein